MTAQGEAEKPQRPHVVAIAGQVAYVVPRPSPWFPSGFPPSCTCLVYIHREMSRWCEARRAIKKTPFSCLYPHSLSFDLSWTWVRVGTYLSKGKLRALSSGSVPPSPQQSGATPTLLQRAQIHLWTHAPSYTFSGRALRPQTADSQLLLTQLQIKCWF